MKGLLTPCNHSLDAGRSPAGAAPGWQARAKESDRPSVRKSGPGAVTVMEAGSHALVQRTALAAVIAAIVVKGYLHLGLSQLAGLGQLELHVPDVQPALNPH